MSASAKSPILWKGLHRTLQLEMTVIYDSMDAEYIYVLVELRDPSGDKDSVWDVRYKKDKMHDAIDNGDFEELVHNCYMQSAVAEYLEHKECKRHVH